MDVLFENRDEMRREFDLFEVELGDTLKRTGEEDVVLLATHQHTSCSRSGRIATASRSSHSPA